MFSSNFSNDSWSAQRTRSFSSLTTDLPMFRSRQRHSLRNLAADFVCFISRHIRRTETRDELVWKHLKADTIGRTTITSFNDFKNKVKSSMISLQRSPEKIRSFFQKPSLKYAA